MDQNEARRYAHTLVGSAVQTLLDTGWPFTMVDDGPAFLRGIQLQDDSGRLTRDGVRLLTALNKIVTDADARGRGGRP